MVRTMPSHQFHQGQTSGMRHCSFLVLLWAALLAPALSPAAQSAHSSQITSPAPAAKPPVITRVAEIEGVTEYRLANGLRVLLIPDPTVDTVTLNVVYLVGSRHEGNGETGMAHLLEHLLFRGTARHPDIKGEFQKRGARYNGTTSFDRTNYYETLPATRENLDWAIGLEADRMLNSKVSQKDLDAEMTVVRNEFESGENSAPNVLRERVTATAYLWHGYGRPIIGARSDIENVPIEKLQAFYRLHYQPDNATLIIAGRFQEADALGSVQRHFSRIPKPARKLPQTYTVEPTQDGERTVTLRRVGDVQMVSALYHFPPGTHADYAAVDLLTSLLSHVPTGRLHKALVQQGKASSVFGFERQQREAGYAYFGASVRKELSLDAARDALLSTLEELQAQPVTEEEVELARARLLNSIEDVISDSRSLALTLTDVVAMGDWRMLFLHRDRLREVSAADVQRAGLRYLKSSNRTMGMFLPTTEVDRAEIPLPPNLDSELAGYKGRGGIAQGEVFDPTPANIEARTLRRTLPNGMKLALLPKRTRGSTVEAHIVLHWGNEESKMGRSTACGIASAMLGRGTLNKTREQITNELTRLRAKVGVGMEGGSVDTVRENFPGALALLAEMLRQPSFPEAEFEQLRQSSLASIESQRSDPGARASLVLNRHLRPFPERHWYYNPTPEERIDRLKALRLEDVRRCHADFLGASVSELAIVGDFDPAQATKLATELFGNWKTPAAYKRLPTPYVPAPALDRVIETPDKANAVFRAGMNLRMRDDHSDYPALVLANYLIGGTSNSRLYRRIREQEGLSYSVSSSLSVSSFEEAGQFAISAIYAPQNRDRLEGIVREELQRALAEGFSDEEVSMGKQGLLQARQLGRNQDGALASRLVSHLHLGRTFAWDERLEERIASLTPAEVNAAARRHLRLEQLSMVRAGDFKSALAQAPLPSRR
jgi:zinc protease